MTEQEIAKLVFNAGSLGEFPKLLRLLEERRRLLEAVRGINARGESDDFIACEDAQAFAEEESK